MRACRQPVSKHRSVIAGRMRRASNPSRARRGAGSVLRRVTTPRACQADNPIGDLVAGALVVADTADTWTSLGNSSSVLPGTTRKVGRPSGGAGSEIALLRDAGRQPSGNRVLDLCLAGASRQIKEMRGRQAADGFVAVPCHWPAARSSPVRPRALGPWRPRQRGSR